MAEVLYVVKKTTHMGLFLPYRATIGAAPLMYHVSPYRGPRSSKGGPRDLCQSTRHFNAFVTDNRGDYRELTRVSCYCHYHAPLSVCTLRSSDHKSPHKVHYWGHKDACTGTHQEPCQCTVRPAIASSTYSILCLMTVICM